MFEIDIQKIAGNSAAKATEKITSKLSVILEQAKNGDTPEQIQYALFKSVIEISGTISAEMLLAYHDELSTQLEKHFVKKEL